MGDSFTHRRNELDAYEDIDSPNWGRSACGLKDENLKFSMLPSGYDCPKCIEVAPMQQAIALVRRAVRARYWIQNPDIRYHLDELSELI